MQCPTRKSLFIRHDEVEAAWEWTEPILHAGHAAVHRYPAGSGGPTAARELIESDGRHWNEDNA